MTSTNNVALDQPKSRYIHATLYKFTTTGRASVLDAFHHKIGKIAAECSYDVTKDLFELSCPTSEGPLCDEALRDVIDSYVEHELEAAVREQREPEIQRFPESQWEWHDGGEEGPERMEEHGAPPPAVKPVMAHIVVVNDYAGKKLKFFRMGQLPEAFMQRALCPETRRARDVFAYGVTCRAVRWKNGEGFVFNGRDGADSLWGGSNSEQSECPDFPILSDTRDQATLEQLGPEIEEPATAHWQHVGPDPGVDLWLLGVGETRQVSPEEAAELPKETKSMLAADEMHGIGRTRVPKGYTPGMVFENCSSDDGEDSPETKPSFAAAMQSGHISSDSDASSDSEFTSKAKPSFSSLLPTTENKPPDRMSGWATVDSPKQAPGRAGQPDLQDRAILPATPFKSAVPRPLSTVQNVADLDPDWGKYAKVDHVGLTANPGLTAAYNMENYIPTPVKEKFHPIMPRVRKSHAQAGTDLEGTVTRNRSETGSLLAPASVGSTSAATTRSQAQSVSPAQWEQNLSNMRVPQARLINISSRPSTEPTAVPPGLVEARKRPPKRAPPQQTDSQSLVDATEINLMDSSPPRTPTITMPPSGHILQPETAERRQAVHSGEKLAVYPPDFSRKHNTMNQRAGKNTKSNGKNMANTNGKKPKVELPLPDPLPAPRVKKVVEVPKPIARDQAVSAASPQAQDDDLRSINAFSHLLFETIEKQTMSDIEDDDHVATAEFHKLVVQFGQILSVAEEDSFSKQEASPLDVVQELMNSSRIQPHLFPGLTTSASDANLLIKLTGADKIPKLVYEVSIKDAAGWLLLCTIPADDKARFTVQTKDQAAGYEYIHCPVHVWDARIGLYRPGVNRKSPSHEAIVQFVSSMKTDEGVPSFCAYLPSGQFVVEAVLARRVFENDTDGIVSRVVEIQHFVQENTRGGRYNFRATALSDIEMIDYQRLWWEASIETYDLDKAEDLRGMAISMVEQMDRIGNENIGPWSPHRQLENEKGEVAPLLWDALGRAHLERVEMESHF